MSAEIYGSRKSYLKTNSRRKAITSSPDIPINLLINFKGRPGSKLPLLVYHAMGLTNEAWNQTQCSSLELQETW